MSLLGVTFKENCPDIRNTKVVDIYGELCEFGVNVDVYDPWVCPNELKKEYGIDTIKNIAADKKYETIILAVAHDEFKAFDFEKYYNTALLFLMQKLL